MKNRKVREQEWPCRKCGESQDTGLGELCTYCWASDDMTIHDDPDGGFHDE